MIRFGDQNKDNKIQARNNRRRIKDRSYHNTCRRPYHLLVLLKELNMKAINSGRFQRSYGEKCIFNFYVRWLLRQVKLTLVNVWEATREGIVIIKGPLSAERCSKKFVAASWRVFASSHQVPFASLRECIILRQHLVIALE
ncbi:hypothetical protein V6N12_028187 [Hibiscus sabdariffa]|uniref:Uncharacterized protein n=1 Tax=Hibiscus sabdariffa TaxID=183260 RepID=A0ABR2F523_9ROSI